MIAIFLCCYIMNKHTITIILTRTNSYDLWNILSILQAGNFVGICMKDHT